MPQAKIVSEQELKRALAVVAARRFAERDRLALLMTHWAGMRVCEVAALTRDRVMGSDGSVLDEVLLAPDGTKGSKGRVVYINSKLKKEIAAYLKSHPSPRPDDPLLLSQKANRKRRGFSANTLCQLINGIYKEAGIKGASSHSGGGGSLPSSVMQASA